MTCRARWWLTPRFGAGPGGRAQGFAEVRHRTVGRVAHGADVDPDRKRLGRDVVRRLGGVCQHAVTFVQRIQHAFQFFTVVQSEVGHTGTGHAIADERIGVASVRTDGGQVCGGNAQVARFRALAASVESVTGRAGPVIDGVAIVIDRAQLERKIFQGLLAEGG